ncbi:stage III sporulation protein AF [Calderihabitans maritimus]|uniref:Stage III sporulation protein AF n=1 Tax=Calderihabitans maritimus TaxID=1246530 RepID=A0A1Z5HXA5_9FIRM|nr:stage III sporulation protein AF [Calderihabitans maritimus]GAW94162.1 stage III sporulation protein AF [Calderihabitans maritimus]
MDILRDLVRNLAVIVLLAGFAEMLLPNSDMRRYVKLVMGLFVLITVLNPVVTLLEKQQLNFEVSAWQYSVGNEALDTILRKSEELKSTNAREALEEYRRRVERQIQALVELIPGVEKVEARVEVEENRDLVTFGSLRAVYLTVETPTAGGEREVQESKESGMVRKIPPVKIEIGKKTRDEKEISSHQRLEAEIISTVANFYGLRPEQVKVTIKIS